MLECGTAENQANRRTIQRISHLRVKLYFPFNPWSPPTFLFLPTLQLFTPLERLRENAILHYHTHVVVAPSPCYSHARDACARIALLLTAELQSYDALDTIIDLKTSRKSHSVAQFPSHRVAAPRQQVRLGSLVLLRHHLNQH